MLKEQEQELSKETAGGGLSSTNLICYHCGETCNDSSIHINEKLFCCNGCKAVYQLLNDTEMCNYYAYNENAGIKPQEDGLSSRFSYLDDDEVKSKLIEFSQGNYNSITFYIPQMHCSSCIYLLEKLYKIENGIESSRVNFLRKEATIRYNTDIISLRKVVELLSRIGYEPKISLASLEKKAQYNNLKQLYLKIGLAGFAFGNVMLLSFPEYLARLTKIPADFSQFFGYLNLFLATPALIYSGRDYFVSAYTGLRQKHVNIDVPISLGMFVLYLRSLYEIILQIGPGYLDSMTGLIFFLLLGKLFQQKTYDTLSFERDYKSFFPIAITLIKEGMDKIVPLSRLAVGDRIVVRNHELIPADSILLNGDALIDYSFVTGESNPVPKASGDLIYAGGRQAGSRLELEVVKDVSQSYLTRLWNNENKDNTQENKITHRIDIVSKYFTFIVLSIASIAGIYWYSSEGIGIAINIFTAVLIVACPCALALSYPFTMGNAMRIMGRKKLFLKNIDIVERMAHIEEIIFDKTGTLTHTRMSRVRFVGKLNEEAIGAAMWLSANSTHPLSKQIQEYLKLNSPQQKPRPMAQFTEVPGKGILAEDGKAKVYLGSKKWVEKELRVTLPNSRGSTVYLAIDKKYIGYFLVRHALREGIKATIENLKEKYTTAVVSGDNEAEKKEIQNIFGESAEIRFNQSPEDKLEYIEFERSKNKVVMMIGDGLNDGAALLSSDVGFSIVEETAQFTPASDGILEAASFESLPIFLSFSKKSVNIVIASFIMSFIYNIGGLFFAISGNLSPIVAAILMPLSSISVIAFSTLMTLFEGKKRGLI